MLGTMGKRVVIADFDAVQFTGMVLGYKGVDDLQDLEGLRNELVPSLEKAGLLNRAAYQQKSGLKPRSP
jgi:hypothetical protein